ncbi:MAG TPA: lysophospholipid acyltransferase family protein [Saprospiraceae bacterium]|nr:lysophospholipid acyltransferase family protein [Saprospiraceae bacterium]HMQ85244.1 lysophospholipid acyltransferase family protein [Saprospiraceae bacterium]
MFRWLSRQILHLSGWEIVKPFDAFPDKYVLVAAPHTSNWDFVLGILTRSILKMGTNFVGKKSLFIPPFGWYFRWLGGYPVDRSKNSNFVDAVVEIFKKEKKFSIAIAPEGTRKKVGKLKTGFYYIAKGAGVAIVLVRLDYGNKQVAFAPPFLPTADMELDMARVMQFFKGVQGKKPENGLM